VSELLRDTVVIQAPPDRIRTMLHDPEALRRVLPGCESLSATGPDTYAGVLSVRLAFMTVRADVAAVIDEGDGSGSVRLEMNGRPRGLAGAFTVVVPFELEPVGEGSQVSYGIDLTVSGRLAAFGTLILRDATRRQIAELVRNVEREVTT
jgi:carbon monoxide dehydrogenase subunit G